MKNKLLIIALVAVFGFSMATCSIFGSDDEDGGSEYWLISAQYSYSVKDGINDILSHTFYDWIAYRYTDETNYEEEYTTLSYGGNNSYSDGVGSISNSRTDSYSEYHNIREGQTSHSTTETVSRTISSQGDYTNLKASLSSGASSTTSTYDSASGLTLSVMTTNASGDITATSYAVEPFGDMTYKHYPYNGNGYYTMYKIQDGRTQEARYYNASGQLISTTIYSQPDNEEIRARLPKFTLYSSYDSNYTYNSYQTAEILSTDRRPFEANSSALLIRVKTFTNGVLSSQTEYIYGKIKFDVNGNISDSGFHTTAFGDEFIYDKNGNGYLETYNLEHWGDYWYYEKKGKITITEYTGRGGHINIPSQINGKPVIALLGVRHYKLTSVNIPDIRETARFT